MLLSIVSRPLQASLHILVIISKWSCEEHIKTVHWWNTERGRTSKAGEKLGRIRQRGEARASNKREDKRTKTQQI